MDMAAIVAWADDTNASDLAGFLVLALIWGVQSWKERRASRAS